MGISTDFNYERLLSLDRAKLVKRFRLNFLGSQELILDYIGVTAVAREDCTEWLEANRLTITDPSFGFRTYEGTWYCIDIIYNEDKNSIRQRFKRDSSLKGDVSRRDSGGTILKDYYWRIVDPQAYVIPEYKSVEGTAASDVDDLYWVNSRLKHDSDTIYYDESSTYALWHIDVDNKWYITTVALAGLATPTVGWESATIAGIYTALGAGTGAPVVDTVENHNELWKKTTNDNGDGTYDVIISRDSFDEDGVAGAGAIRAGSETGTQESSNSIFVTDSGDADINGEYSYVGIDAGGNPYWQKDGTTDQRIQWSDVFYARNVASPPDGILLDEAWFILPDPYLLGSSGVGITGVVYRTSGTWLAPFPWEKRDSIYGTAFTVITLMNAEIGKSGPAFKEDSTITINSTEQTFVEDSGTVADPVQGEVKTILNVPLGNGLYRTTVTTKTALMQRLPALYGMFNYTSKGNSEGNGILHGKNRTQAQFNQDVALLSDSSTSLSKLLENNSNSVSVSLNEFGYLDYTILSNKPTV